MTQSKGSEYGISIFKLILFRQMHIKASNKPRTFKQYVNYNIQ